MTARPRRRARHASVTLALLSIGALLGVVACGTAAQEPPGDAVSGRTLTVYTSLPLRGPLSAGARAVLDGERIALAQMGARLGRYRVKLRVLDDATAKSEDWDPGQTSINAHLALADPSTIGYIGDFDSGASAIAIPLLNRAGIAQISPASSAVGLTSNGPGALPGEPAKYYPTGARTFVALAPDDAVQAAVQVRLQHSFGCARTFVLDDGEFDGYDAAASFSALARADGQGVVAVQSFDPHAADYRSVALTVARSRADCVLISALPSRDTTLLVSEVAAAVPEARLFAFAALAQPSFTDPLRGGLPLGLDARVLISAPVFGSDASALDFAAAYERHFGPPDPYAPYGYEAMRLLVEAIRHATDGGRHPARRTKVMAALLAARPRNGPLGAFSIRRDGATTSRHYGIYSIADGRLVLWNAVNAPG